MAKLEKSARIFCQIHGIPADRLFDAEGLPRQIYKYIMKSDEKWAAYGVTRCLNGHVLRNRFGSCLICNPQSVAHMLRSKLSGYLYAASGAGGHYMKLGFSSDPMKRIKQANIEGWGGHDDWQLRAYGWAQEAGALEAELHAEFRHNQVRLPWIRNAEQQFTRESYLADITEAAVKLIWLCDGPIEQPWN
ncbi:GIY-YIG nuclease family protein [Novosphingobium sp. BL-52-GroH]|uniref:GIY-YIG nuclease family protein n=1 Tax=Novosphingobium sp. BL-52-GroH TaxID=3349877 RepID=UPI00384E06E0